jgi:hypothetical protein
MAFRLQSSSTNDFVPFTMKFPQVTLCSVIVASCCLQGESLNGGTRQINPLSGNGWQAFEVISEGDTVNGYTMPGVFDGAHAWLPNPSDPSILRVLVNHELSDEDSTISQVDLRVENLKTKISDTSASVNFVIDAEQAYDRWHNALGVWTTTTSSDNTDFWWLCSGQAFAQDTYGTNRKFPLHFPLL